MTVTKQKQPIRLGYIILAGATLPSLAGVVFQKFVDNETLALTIRVFFELLILLLVYLYIRREGLSLKEFCSKWVLGAKNWLIIPAFLLIGITATIAFRWSLFPDVVVNLSNNTSSLLFSPSSIWDIFYIVINLVKMLLIVPISEEFLFRGLLLRYLLNKVRLFWAVIISSLIFGFVHIVDNPLISLIAGIMLAIIFVRTGSLIFCIISHILFNVLIVFINVIVYPKYLHMLNLSVTTVVRVGHICAFAATILFVLFFVFYFMGAKNRDFRKDN